MAISARASAVSTHQVVRVLKLPRRKVAATRSERVCLADIAVALPHEPWHSTNRAFQKSVVSRFSHCAMETTTAPAEFQC
jgi:hypothetical protein